MPATITPGLEEKQGQFNRAMALYESRSAYKLFGFFIGAANILLQALLLARVSRLSIGPIRQLAALTAAYLIARKLYATGYKTGTDLHYAKYNAVSRQH